MLKIYLFVAMTTIYCVYKYIPSLTEIFIVFFLIISVFFLKRQAARYEQSILNKPKDTDEPSIIINGSLLNDAQSMTVRIAIESLSDSLLNDGLGDDSHGKAMEEGYQNRIDEIRTYIFEHKKSETN